MRMNRRSFAHGAALSLAGIALTTRARAAQARAVDVTVDVSKELATMPPAARANDVLLMAIVNKSGDPVQAKLHGGMARATECWKLTAPSLDAKDGVAFARAKTEEGLISAYAAVLWKSVLR